MGILIDIVIVLIILLSTFLAYKKGLIAQAIKLVAVIISILLTLLLYKPVSNFIINTTGIDEAIQNGIYEKSYETIMGNCDTHVFLGSNSFKTVEYFSKQLGEKTISRDSTTINRDVHNWRTGKSESEQVMARALMTPDELRRLDNDMCIIFVKGLKPVKAKKFYYFKHPMSKEMKELEISHNDIGEIQRGEWRKYNPYNPYVPEKEKGDVTQEDLKIESLDDLFEDIDDTSTKKPKEDNSSTAINLMEELDIPSDKGKQEPIVDSIDNDDDYDLQKELEAKFDELFGPIDDSEN